ncbi:MAG: hypothetical protein AAF985_05025 [Bacteroidota bacterium]
MKAPSIFLFSLLISLTSCKSYYSAKNFKEVAEAHQTIAVVPFEVYTTGQLPKEITEEQIKAVETYESKAFQISFYNKILNRNRLSGPSIPVNIQHYNKTLRILKDNNISITDSWEKSPELLANLLGVDAIVTGRIEKQRYFSDELSAGIDIGTSILNQLGVRQVPDVSRNNKNVIADFSVLDSTTGRVLWSINYQCQADWQQQADQIISRINHRSSKHFPYRIN